MGYSLTKKSVLKVKPLLDVLVGNPGPPIVEWTVLDPQNVAYALRQGMKAAEYLGTQDYPEYRWLSRNYSVKVVIPDRVVATRKIISPSSIEVGKEVPTSKTVIHEVGPDPVSVVATAVGISNWFELQFPNAKGLDEVQMLLLYNWAEGLGDEVFIFQTPDGLTLTKNPQVKELGIQWTPKQKESGSQTTQDMTIQKQKNTGS